MLVCNHWRHLSPNNQCDIHGDAKKGKPRDQLAIHNPGIIDMVAVCAANSIFTLNQQDLALLLDVNIIRCYRQICCHSQTSFSSEIIF